MRISVFGIGYVGAVSAACLAADGHVVVAVDTNPAKAKMINDGVAPIVETGLAELVREGARSGKLRATTSASEAVMGSAASLVCVGTPSLANGNLDLTQVAPSLRSPAVRLIDSRSCVISSYRNGAFSELEISIAPFEVGCFPSLSAQPGAIYDGKPAY